MSDLTHVFSVIEPADAMAGEELLPVVHHGGWKLALHKIAEEAPEQTLQATAPAHAANIRLLEGQQARHRNSGVCFVESPKATSLPSFY